MNTEQERNKLLPCPFCGSTNIEIQISTPDREGVPTNLVCSDCGASGPWVYEQDNSHAKADAAWNRRAALQSPEVQAWKKDAERYRKLSAMATQQADSLGPIFRIDVRRSAPYLFNFDAAIDAAMEKQP